MEGREHRLQPLGDGRNALYLPYATSLRMGRLGYQSDAQSSINVSYNGLDGYADSLHEALIRPYPAYEQLGVKNPGGDYNQLGTGLLQIENEFYGTIRPKRTVKSGERPLHALRERGVEYVEVRLMDIDPYETVGIAPATMRMIDVFLLHCLHSDSPDDTPQEIADLKHNQHLAAEQGREPGLQLVRHGQKVLLTDWAQEVLQQCRPYAQALDAAHHSSDYTAALKQALARVQDAQSTHSAHVLQELTGAYDSNFIDFMTTQSAKARDALLAMPWTAEQQARYEQMSAESVAAQQRIEAADTLTFEEWRQRYMDPASLQ